MTLLKLVVEQGRSVAKALIFWSLRGALRTPKGSVWILPVSNSLSAAT